MLLILCLSCWPTAHEYDHGSPIHYNCGRRIYSLRTS